MNQIRKRCLIAGGRPGPLLVACLVTAAVLMAAAPISQEDEQKDDSISVIHLRYAAARQVANVIQDTIPARITVDERTNALIVGGSEAALASVREIVAQLDVAIEDTKGSDEELVRVYPLAHAVANPQLASTLDSLFEATRSVRRAGRMMFVKPVRIAYDGHTNQIIARGTASAIASLTELIGAIDRAPAKARGRPAELRVRLVWLVGGLAGEHGRNVPPDMGQVIDELGKIGIGDLRLAAQTVVRVTASGLFKTRFVASLDQPWRMSFSGHTFSGDGGARRIKVEIDFTYTTVALAAGDDDLIVTTPSFTNTGSITWLDTGEVIDLFDRANAEGYTFRFGDENSNNGHRWYPGLSGWGWMDHHQAGTHVYSSDWLFTATRPVPGPSGLMVVVAGFLLARRRSRHGRA